MLDQAVIEAILAAKNAKNVSYEEIAGVLGRHPVWVASLVYRQATASQEEASKLAAYLGLTPEVETAIQTSSVKGSLEQIVPVDPLIYRFYEIMQVYGMPMKAIIHEMFGDGIMSAIDFTIDIDKVADPKGDRVKVVFEGKFLPYKKW
jgi:cyanate lyase